MKRPLIPVALLYIGGILCGELAHPPAALLPAAALTLAALALCWGKGRPWLLALLLVLTGWSNAVWHSAIISPFDARRLLGGSAEYAGLRGLLAAPPVERIFMRDRQQSPRSSTVIEAAEISRHGVWEPITGRILAATPGVLAPEFFEGQRVEVWGTIRPPPGPLAQGLFNPRAFYRRQGIYDELQTSSTNDWHIPPEYAAANPPLSERFRRWARKTLALGLPAGDESLQLTWTLLLDWKTPMTDAVEDPFLRAGTYHIFAVDGLRIGLLAGIAIGLLRLAQMPRWLCGLLVVPVLWFYTGLTGWPASAVRATIMASIVIAGWGLRRPGDLLNSLFAASLAILLWEPAQLFQPGFQLSFLVVFCISVLVPPVHRSLHTFLFTGDPFLPETLRPRRPWVLEWAALYLTDASALSLAAWVGSIPLAAWYFHLFTPVGVAANCVVVPATALALMSGLGSLLTGAWLPGAAILFNNATWALMNFIIACSRLAASWSPGNFNVAAPSLAVCVFYYLTLLLVATGWVFRSKHKWAGWAGLGLLAVYCLVRARTEYETARLHLLPLNGAPAVFMRAPGRGIFLLDCGNENSAADILKPFLCAQGVNRLDTLGVAVGRVDYCGGAGVVLDNFAVRAVFAGEASGRSGAYRALIEALRQSPRFRAVKDGDDAGGWTVVHPGAQDRFPQADDNALVLRREFHGHSVLLAPSLGREGQDALMRRHGELRAEIVVAGLPARDEPLCDPLLEMLQPRLIVIVDSQFPATRRAPEKLRNRLARFPAKVLYCREAGALTLVMPADGALRIENSEFDFWPAVHNP
jgi:competence protein ComEC